MSKKDKKAPDDSLHHVEIAVDGMPLPLKIGDKVNVGDGIVRVVMKVQVNEDSGAAFGLQWLEGSEFKLEWFTYSELCYMTEMITNKPRAKYLEA